ncbi:hypothetical protein [Erwinia sp. 198]|uniref:hypothetical protein n=1 Tax=Erwinia sp. 198 TaxID=2022746 RepID=UPI000F672E29|nr:hypothetical protein [Erwinia sp. 198]RRZ95504.1 hypothetical protein EGK14_02725 [Erwinia sp. 198]
MEKQHFLTRLGQWPKIQFSEVCITACGGSVQPELYVRDRAEPPRWLFIRRLGDSENHDGLLALYSQWLTEFHQQRGTDFCLLPPFDRAFRDELPAQNSDKPPKTPPGAALRPLLIAER